MRHGKIIYTVDGIGSVSFGADGRYLLEKFDGTSLGTTKLATTAINLSGQRTSRATLNARTIPCDLAIRAINENGKYSYELLDKLKQDVCKIFNPLYKGTLTRVNRYGTYCIDVSPSEVPTFEKLVGAIAKFKVNFIADNPIWRDTKTKTYHIGGENGPNLKIYNTLGIELPFVFNGTAAVEESYFRLTNETSGEHITLADTMRVEDREFILNTETCEVLTKSSFEDDYQSGDFIFTFQSAVDMVLRPGCNSFVLDAQNEDAVFTIEVTDMFLGVS